MAFDGIITKKVVDELQNIINYKIDKIYQPDKNTILLGLYGKHKNITLLSCISSNNYRIHITTHSGKNPETAPNFCMFLRKHILGYNIKNIYTQNLERIVFIELENFENPEKVLYKKLIIELMGKHSNIILTDENNIIIDSMRHTSIEENAQRDIYPTAKYILPKTDKYNLLNITSFEQFYNLICMHTSKELLNDLVSTICNTFNGLSKSFVNSLLIDFSENFNEPKFSFDSNQKIHVSQKFKIQQFPREIVEKIYNNIKEFINAKKTFIEKVENNEGLTKDFILKIDNTNSEISSVFALNFALDDFYYDKESLELFKNYRNSILALILNTLSKYEKRLNNIDKKLSECEDMGNFKLFGELITANLYKIPNINLSSISLENYYNNNCLIEIPLNSKYSPQYNAKLYFKKYNKLKNALEVVQKQKSDALYDINYIGSIVYELENCSTIGEVQEIYDEISENELFKDKLSKSKLNKKSMINTKSKKFKKNKQMTSNKFESFNPLKYIIDGYTIYVGRNNKENDYLTTKFANKNDIWFHTKDIHGSHVILKTNPNEVIPEEILIEAAKLAVCHSKAKNSSNVPVDYCKVCFVKKPSGSNPGLVIYANNKTIYI